jgi:hypothetical protein
MVRSNLREQGLRPRYHHALVAALPSLFRHKRNVGGHVHRSASPEDGNDSVFCGSGYVHAIGFDDA